MKMVHNGIEYGMMASIAEGLSIIKHANAGKVQRDVDAETTPLRDPQFYQYDMDIPEIAELWRRGSVIGSWLIDLTADALARSPQLDQFQGRVSDSGEGRWTVIAAVEEGVPASVITMALKFDPPHKLTLFLADFLEQTGTSVILDRNWPSEIVYSEYFNRQTDADVVRQLDESVAVLPAVGATVASAAWSPDGTWIALGTMDGRILGWQPRGGDVTAPVGAALDRAAHGAAIWDVAFSPDGRRLASASADATVAVHDLVAATAPAALTGHESAVYGVAFSPDGARLATASRDRTIRLWDAPTMTEAGVLRGHEGTVYSVRFSPQGDRLVSASQDGTVRVWSVTDRREERGRGRAGPGVARRRHARPTAPASAACERRRFCRRRHAARHGVGRRPAPHLGRGRRP
ncbi:MAG: hypothetical protein EBX36_08090 [Planctomycetia bacterium]|nr:hypothetical protein [Planctomycetia bacterium]